MTTLPIDITFRGLDPSPMVDVFVRRWATRLQRTFDLIQRCAVVIELPHRHHEHGRAFRVRIDVTMPDREVVISHEPGAASAHEDVYLAVRDAFRAARRQLATHKRRLHSHVVGMSPANLSSS